MLKISIPPELMLNKYLQELLKNKCHLYCWWSKLTKYIPSALNKKKNIFKKRTSESSRHHTSIFITDKTSSTTLRVQEEKHIVAAENIHLYTSANTEISYVVKRKLEPPLSNTRGGRNLYRYVLKVKSALMDGQQHPRANKTTDQFKLIVRPSSAGKRCECDEIAI